MDENKPESNWEGCGCLILFIGAIIICILGAQADYTERKYQKTATFEDAKVIIHGCNTQGWIENTNEFPVRIKQVWIFNSSEKTEWIKVFQPGEKKYQYIHFQHGFYILNLEGTEIGWIDPC